MNARLDRFMRRFAPSVAVLARKRWLMPVLDAPDVLARLAFPEYRVLPPNRLRVRVGVGNRILLNQSLFLKTGVQQAMRLFALGFARPDSAILELGCGCGRLAIALRESGTFNGRYTGVDVDREMVEWCATELAGAGFEFLHADVHHQIYNPEGPDVPYTVPLPDGSQQLVTSNSLFSHLLEPELNRYLAEAVRLLGDGGWMAMSAFTLDDMEALGELGGRWTFPHRIGSARVQDIRYPEAAVAYERSYLVEAAMDAGFSSAEVLRYPMQSVLACRK